jgi:hypothetical protein
VIPCGQERGDGAVVGGYCRGEGEKKGQLAGKKAERKQKRREEKKRKKQIEGRLHKDLSA